MADNSLDDFFAKKDKSKKKNKSKTTPSDILSKHDNFVSVDREAPAGDNVSDTTKLKKKKKDKDKQNAATSNSDSTNTGNGNVKKDDEEWVDFVDESEKDYTGLRIQNLQISQKEGEEVEEEDKENENDEDGESGEKRDMSGPWNVSQSSRPRPKKRVEVVQEAPPPPPEEPPSDDPTKAPTKYVPPGARGSQASGDSGMGGSRAAMMRRKKGAPNLKSEDDFPTLGGGVPEIASWGPSGSGNFERVQGGGKQMEDPSKANVQLSLGNKYAALQD